MAALSHPNILTLYDVGIESDRSWAVTELLEREILQMRVVPSALSWQRAAEIGIAVAEVLAAAHVRGNVYRDPKPAKIFVTSDGE